MDWYVSLAVGLFMILFGAGYILRHLAAARHFREDADLNARQKKYLISQQKRRLITSGLVIFCGLLIPALDYAIAPLQNHLLATTLLIGLLIALLLIFILAISDLFSSRYFREDVDLKRAESELKRRVLEQELEKHQDWKTDFIQEERRHNGDS